MKSLGKNITKYRESKELSQEDLAKKLFVTPQAISRWERGVTEPSVDKLVLMSEILNVSFNKLTGTDDSAFSYNFRKITHLIYLIESIVMIAFSLFLITTYFWSAPKTLYITFIVCSLIFLCSVFVLEIINSSSYRKNLKNKRNY